MKLINILIYEISNKVEQYLIDKFISEDNTLSPNVIKIYIRRFNEIKNSSKIIEKDIMKYSWDDLESIVDDNPVLIKTGKFNITLPDSNLIYDKNHIKVYKSDSKDACIKYGQNYSFCISSRNDDSYRAYRIYDQYTPYFVFFMDKSFEKDENGSFVDSTHLLVVMVSEEMISVTTADNHPDDTQEYTLFDELLIDFPQLAPLKPILKPIELNHYDEFEKLIHNNYHTDLTVINKDAEKFEGYVMSSVKDYQSILNGEKKILKVSTNLFDVAEYLIKNGSINSNDPQFVKNVIGFIWGNKGDNTQVYGRFYVRDRSEFVNEVKQIIDREFEFDETQYRRTLKNIFGVSVSVENLTDQQIKDAIFQTLQVDDLTDLFLVYAKKPQNIAALEHIDFLKKKLRSDLNKISMGVFENLYFV